MKKILFILKILFLLSKSTDVALAQSPEIGGLLPAGGPRGQVTRVQIEGRNLVGARLHLSGSGVTVKSLQVKPDGSQLTAEIGVTPEARLGPHEVRISTPKGVSNGARFWADVAPNRVLEQPMAENNLPTVLEGTPPVVWNGRIAAKKKRAVLFPKKDWTF